MHNGAREPCARISVRMRSAPQRKAAMDPERRDLLKAASIIVVSLAAMQRAVHVHAKDLPHLSETDPQAAALGYKNDSKLVDAKKYANYRLGQDCDDCVHYKGKPRETWGPCDIFPGKSVNAHGWCAAFQPKKA
jgi:hypothetical protein